MFKTRTLVLQSPKPLLLFETEGGMTSVKSELHPAEPTDPHFAKLVSAGFKLFNCQVEEKAGFPGDVWVKSYATSHKDAYFEILSDMMVAGDLAHLFKSVGLDSATELCRLIQVYTTQLPLRDKKAQALSEDEKHELDLGMSRVPQLPDWGQTTERARQVLRKVRDFVGKGLNVFVTALEKEEYELGADAPYAGVPNLAGSIREEVPALFDEVWHFTQIKMVVEGQPRTIVVAKTDNEGIWRAKSRLNLPKQFSVEKVHTILRKL